MAPARMAVGLRASTLSAATSIATVATALIAVAAVAQASGDTPTPASYPRGSCDTTPQAQDALAHAALVSLEAQGYTVARGNLTFSFVGLFSANPSSKYGLYSFQLLGDDGEVHEGHEGAVPMWYLGAQDAVLWLGCTPPVAKYFSFRSYVFETPSPPAIPFGSMGDSLNNWAFNTTMSSSSAPGQGTSFNATAAVITTADEGTDSAVRSALAAAGLDSGAINTDIVPSTLPGLTLGRNPFADAGLTMLFRTSIFEDAQAGAAYSNATYPVYMIRAPANRSDAAVAASPFPTPPLRQRGTGVTEMSKGLDKAKAALLTAVLNGTATGAAVTTTRYDVAPVPLEGRTCIAEHTQCAGDNRDAAYGATNKSTPFSLPGADDFVMLVGVNHASAGKATYANFALDTVSMVLGKIFPEGVAGTSVNDELWHGSAEHFSGGSLPGVTPAQLANLFAFKLARTCATAEPFCRQLPASVKADAQLLVVTREYLERATDVGPLASELVTTTAVVVNKV